MSRPTESAFAAAAPTVSEPTSPGPAVTAIASTSARSTSASASARRMVGTIASRWAREAMVPTIRRALAEADVDLAEVDVGLDIPLYGVNHVIGHAAVDELVHGEFPARVMALVVSGGHSSLLLVDDIVTGITELGQTLDDAAGEAFDKVGRLLGLPYPGGPHLDRLARGGNPEAIRFPRGLSRREDLERHRYDFAFSGLKTAVARWVEARQDAGEEIPLADVAASFAASVADVLTAKTIAACQRLEVDTLVIGGGFSANSQLRELAAERCAEAGITLRIPPIRFCTDNGAMIAALGSAALRRGIAPSDLGLQVDSSMPLTLVTG